MSIAKVGKLKAIKFIIVIIPILFFGCSSFKRAFGIDPNYIFPDHPGGRECAEQSWQVRHECENESLSQKNQCLERARTFADYMYQREMNQYIKKEASCEEAYQRALREYEIIYRKYKRCLQHYDDPFERKKKCGIGHRNPDRWTFFAHIVKPDYDHIIYSHENNCKKRYKKGKGQCFKKFQRTWINICRGRIEY